MNYADLYRARAAECERRTRLATDEVQRAVLLEQARLWLGFAERVEAVAGLPESRASAA